MWTKNKNFMAVVGLQICILFVILHLYGPYKLTVPSFFRSPNNVSQITYTNCKNNFFSKLTHIFIQTFLSWS